MSSNSSSSSKTVYAGNGHDEKLDAEWPAGTTIKGNVYTTLFYVGNRHITLTGEATYKAPILDFSHPFYSNNDISDVTGPFLDILREGLPSAYPGKISDIEQEEYSDEEAAIYICRSNEAEGSDEWFEAIFQVSKIPEKSNKFGGYAGTCCAVDLGVEYELFHRLEHDHACRKKIRHFVMYDDVGDKDYWFDTWEEMDDFAKLFYGKM